MNKKKMTILGTAFVVAVVALAGIGYAAATVAYNGTTASTENTTNNAYVTVGLGAAVQYTNAFNASIYYNTETTSTGTTYTPTNLTDGKVSVGTITIAYDTSNGKTGDTFKLSVAASSGYDTTAGVWFYKVGTGSITAMTMTGTDIMTGIAVANATSTTFELYYMPQQVASTAQAPATPTVALDNVTFTITLASEVGA